jgi:hypothetical protein
MPTALATIRAGVCGFITTVRTTADDDFTVQFQLTTTCPCIQQMSERLQSLELFEELGARYESEIWEAARFTPSVCADCIVPNGVLKAARLAAGLALPAQATIDLCTE